MKNVICMLLIGFTIFIVQEVAGQDTLTVKSAVGKDTTIYVAPPAPGGQPAQQNPKPVQNTNRQRKDTRPWSQRIDFDINTSFWSSSTQVFSEFMVTVAYRFPKIWSIGAGPTYVMNYDRKNDINLNGWGGKVFARAQFLRFLYAWTEYQGIDNQYVASVDPVTRDSKYVDSWFVGAGLNFRMGRRSGFNISVLYDLLHSSYSPYSEAVTYRVGFGF